MKLNYCSKVVKTCGLFLKDFSWILMLNSGKDNSTNAALWLTYCLCTISAQPQNTLYELTSNARHQAGRWWDELECHPSPPADPLLVPEPGYVYASDPPVQSAHLPHYKKVLCQGSKWLSWHMLPSVCPVKRKRGSLQRDEIWNHHSYRPGKVMSQVLHLHSQIYPKQTAVSLQINY